MMDAGDEADLDSISTSSEPIAAELDDPLYERPTTARAEEAQLVVLEVGTIRFFARPRIDVPTPKSVGDVQRLSFTLAPRNREIVRRVAVGMLTPVRSWLGATGLVELARRAVAQIELETDERGRISPDRLAEEAAHIELARREALSPALRLQRTLHPWVAFGIMPLFAFANASVPLEGATTSLGVVGAGVVVGLVAGKPIGILVACALAVRTRIAMLPTGIGWREVSVLGLVAGIGFTMSLFVAAMAFPDPAHLAAAKLGILLASVLAIGIGFVAGRLLLGPRRAGEA